jgi:quinol-cytochrome oxidoreductase complex cytochrome b subunit
MTNDNKTPKELLSSMAFGGIFVLVGAFIVLVAADIIHADPSSFNAPRWVVGAAGGTFMLAGMMVAMQGAFGPDGQQTLLYLWLNFFFGLALMLLFSSVFLWVGFGPGEREFSTSTTVGSVTTSGAGSVSMGRLVFGGSGVVMILVTIAMAYSNWKKIRDFDG